MYIEFFHDRSNIICEENNSLILTMNTFTVSIFVSALLFSVHTSSYLSASPSLMNNENR